MPSGNQACASDVATLRVSRNFIQIPDPKTCGRTTHYYGVDCQYMEIDGVTENFRGASSPLRTWRRRQVQFCDIGRTEAPPDLTQVTVRFYEPCTAGVPLPYYLDQCRFRAIVNHGLCKSSGSLVDGWSQYSEVFDLLPISRNGGRRTSYDGTDGARVLEITADLLNSYQFGPMYFTRVNLDQGICGGVDFLPGGATYGCYVGCGQVVCGCQQPCDDGTNTIYHAGICDGATQASVLITNDGGVTWRQSLLPAPPAPSALGDESTYQVAVVGNTLYYTAYENPVVLYSLQLDENGFPAGAWVEVAQLSGRTTGVTINDGTAAEIVTDGDKVHILVEAPGGSRYYRLDFNTTPADGELFVFPDTAAVNVISACGSTVVAGGANNALYISRDDGDNWNTMAVPATLPGTTTITSVRVNADRIWIGTDGEGMYSTTDEGFTWRQVTGPLQPASINHINFFGEDVGWVSGDTGFYSNWVGGLEGAEWTTQAPRIANFPTGFVANDIVIPECASTLNAGNTVMLVGTEGGETVSYIGRTRQTGI